MNSETQFRESLKQFSEEVKEIYWLYMFIYHNAQ